MMIAFDFFGRLEREIRRRGYRKIRKLRLPKQKVVVYGAGGDIIVAHGPFYPSGNIKTQNDLQKEFDEYLKELKEKIERDILVPLAPKSLDLFFPGGGNLTIPDWFKEFCRSRNINIRILEPSISILSDLPIEYHEELR